VKIPADATVYEGVVAFHDCDPLGIVWHGNYYRYLEHARTALLSRYRLDVQDFVDMDRRLLMIETRCRHASPLRYGDRFRVSAWFIDTEMRINVGYQIHRVEDGRRVARAWTVLVVTDHDFNMSLETPDEVQRRIAEGPFDAQEV